MKRVMLVAGVVAALAAAANAGQVNLILTSTDATNGVVDASSALALRQNPTVLPGAGREVTLWMVLDPSVLPQGQGVAGMFMDTAQTGGQSWASDQVANAGPSGRWSSTTNGVAGGPGYVYQGLSYGAIPPFVGVGGAAPDATIGGLQVYRMASGTFNAVAGGGLYLEIPDFASIGINDLSNTNAGAAFGFAAGGAWDDLGVYTNDNTPVPARGVGQGFLADGAANGPIRTITADLSVVPEPTTIALLGLAGLFIRRRR